MHHDDIWQVFRDNGLPVTGRGATREGFEDDHSLVMGNAHVWLWRSRARTIEILLQKRSQTVVRSPGHHHSSASGHINLGETAADAAQRETKEEIGIDINSEELYFVQSARAGRRNESINFAFVYQLEDEVMPRFYDGEVESVDWLELTTFESMANDPARHKLVPQGSEYFSLLIQAIKRLNDENH